MSIGLNLLITKILKHITFSNTLYPNRVHYHMMYVFLQTKLKMICSSSLPYKLYTKTLQTIPFVSIPVKCLLLFCWIHSTDHRRPTSSTSQCYSLETWLSMRMMPRIGTSMLALFKGTITNRLIPTLCMHFVIKMAANVWSYSIVTSKSTLRINTS